MKWAGEKKARAKCREHMAEARAACRRYQETGDPIFLEIARVHRITARHFHRHAWKGPTCKPLNSTR